MLPVEEEIIAELLIPVKQKRAFNWRKILWN
jgi:hypothetical protein